VLHANAAAMTLSRTSHRTRDRVLYTLRYEVRKAFDEAFGPGSVHVNAWPSTSIRGLKHLALTLLGAWKIQRGQS
jgi:hypothetical protein